MTQIDTSREAVATPLEWDGQTLPGEVAAAEPYLGPRYAILARDEGGFTVRTGRGAGYFDGMRRHESVDDAKAACEAQWQTSVRQLVPALLSERDAAVAELAALKAERERLRGVVRAARNYHDHSKAHFSDGDFDRDGGLAESEAELCVALYALTAWEGGE